MIFADNRLIKYLKLASNMENTDFEFVMNKPGPEHLLNIIDYYLF